MGNADFATAAMAGLRAALIADPAVAALVGVRVVDAPLPGIVFPYIRFGRLVPLATDGAA